MTHTLFLTFTIFCTGRMIALVCPKSFLALVIILFLQTLQFISYFPKFSKFSVLSFGFPNKFLNVCFVLCATLVPRSSFQNPLWYTLRLWLLLFLLKKPHIIVNVVISSVMLMNNITTGMLKHELIGMNVLFFNEN